jgi:hypothetical protein
MLPHADGECRDGDVETSVAVQKFASHRSNLTQIRGSLA